MRSDRSAYKMRRAGTALERALSDERKALTAGVQRILEAVRNVASGRIAADAALSAEVTVCAMWRRCAAWLGARSTRATRIRLMQLGALAFSVGIAACGGTAASTSAPIARTSNSESGAALIKAPSADGAVCSKVTQSVSFTVMCPTAWPRTAAAGEPQVGVLATTHTTYLVNAFNGLGDHSAHIFHLLFGGQNTPFRTGLGSIDPGLRVTTRDVRIPMTGGGTFVQQLAVRYIGSTTVHHRHARILQEPPYPQGGVQGGHVLVLWNESGHGYLVSVHGQGLTKPALIAAAVGFADSTSPV